MSKKPKKRKQLSAYEIERRHKLREQRKIQLKKEKRLFWIKAVIIAVLFVSFFIGIFWIDWHFDGSGLIIYLDSADNRCHFYRPLWYTQNNFLVLSRKLHFWRLPKKELSRAFLFNGALQNDLLLLTWIACSLSETICGMVYDMCNYYCNRICLCCV